MNHTSSERIVVLSLLAASAAGISGCGRPSPAATPTPADARALAVHVQAAASRTFERRLTVQGTLDVCHSATVAARLEGNLDAIWVDEGDAVTAGVTRLFLIDPVSRSNALTVAEQALAVARAGLDVRRAGTESAEAEARKAALDLGRYTRLHADGKVSDNEFETRQTIGTQAAAGLAVARAHVALAERQLLQAEASRDIARKSLADTLVVAPISGVVSQRSAEPGEQLAVGRAVLRIVDPRTLEAAAFLPARYHADVIPDRTTFRLRVAGLEVGQHLVTYRSPTIHTALRTFEIKGLVDNAAGLAVPGSMAELTLVFESREAVGVPSAAILNRAGQQVVFVVRDGRAAQIAVQVGLQNDAWSEIRSGLAAGDQVVTEGQTQLQDGVGVDVL